MSVVHSRELRSHGNDESSFTPRFLFDVMRRWWKQSVILGLMLGGLLGGIGYALWSPRWEATAWLKVDPTFIDRTERFDILAFARGQLELFKSPPVLEKAIADPDVEQLLAGLGVKDPLDWVRKRITTTTMGESHVFVVTLACEYPKAPHIVVNAIVKAYLDFTSLESDQQLSIRMEGLKTQRSTLQSRIAELRSQWMQLAKQTSRTPFEVNQPSSATQKVTFLMLQLNEVNTQLSGLRAKFSAKNSTASKVVGAEKTDVEDLRWKIDRVRNDVARMESSLALIPPTSPLRKPQRDELTREISAGHLKLSQYRELQEAIAAGKEISALQSEISEIETRRKTIETELNREIALLDGNKGSRLDMESLYREIQTKEQFVNDLSQQTTKVEAEAAIKRVREMKHAAPPKSMIEDGGPVRRALLCGLLGLILPALLFVVREYIRQPIGSAMDLAKATALPEVGEIAVTSRLLGSSRPQIATAAETRFIDSVDYLRVSLLGGKDRGHVRCIAIASAEEGEGKTTLAYNFARCLAVSNAGRVLLVDADLRRPSLHQHLQLASEPGLVDCLNGESDFFDVVQSSKIERLDFLAAGLIEGSPAVLFADQRFSRFVEFIRAKYDFVVIDTPPVLSFGETLVVGEAADGVVMCALRDRSRASAIAKARGRLEASGVRILGAVLNAAPSTPSTNSYYYRKRVGSERRPAQTLPIDEQAIG